MYTAPYTGEYIITLNGAGGGVDNQFGLSPERTSLGGKTTIRVKAEKGATLSPKALLEVAALMQSARAARKALDTERDNYMTADEALAYGLIDEIVQPKR